MIPAFLRALRDPFPPARTAGVMGFLASAEFFSLKDCAVKILPALCTLTVDPEHKVRDQVNSLIYCIISTIPSPENGLIFCSQSLDADGDFNVKN